MIRKNINNSERDCIDEKDSNKRERNRGQDVLNLSDTKNIIKKNKNGLMAIHKALTGISLISNNRYINVLSNLIKQNKIKIIN